MDKKFSNEDFPNFGNEDFARMVKEAMNDPELIKNIAAGMMNETGSNPIDAIVDETLGEIIGVIQKINNVIETSDNYSDLLNETSNLLENGLVDFISLIDVIMQTWFDNSGNLDEVLAASAYRKYRAYVNAGFTGEQAFALINQKDIKNDNTVMNNINKVLKQATDSLNKRN